MLARRRSRPGWPGAEYGVRAGRPAVYGAQRWATLRVYAGDLAIRVLRESGRGRQVLDEAARKRRARRSVRLAAGQIRPLVADYPDGVDDADDRSRPGKIRPRDAGHAQHAQDRRRRARARTQGGGDASCGRPNMKYMLMMNVPGGGPYQIGRWPRKDIEAHIA